MPATYPAHWAKLDPKHYPNLSSKKAADWEQHTPHERVLLADWHIKESPGADSWYHDSLRSDAAKAKTEMQKKGSSELLHGGRADNVPSSAFPAKKLREGMKVEREHTSNRRVTEEIAKDHLSEDVDYYRKLKKMEKRAGHYKDPPPSLGRRALEFMKRAPSRGELLGAAAAGLAAKEGVEVLSKEKKAMMDGFFDEMEKISEDGRERQKDRASPIIVGAGSAIAGGVGAGATIVHKSGKAFKKVTELHKKHLDRMPRAGTFGLKKSLKKVDRISEASGRLLSRVGRKSQTAINVGIPAAAVLSGLTGAAIQHHRTNKAEKTKKAAAPKIDPAKARKMVEQVANFKFSPFSTPKRGALTGGVVGGLFSGASAVGKEHDERAKDLQSKLSPQEAKKAKRHRLVGHAMNMATGVGTGSLAGAGIGFAHRGINRLGAEAIEKGVSDRAAAAWRGFRKGISEEDIKDATSTAARGARRGILRGIFGVDAHEETGRRIKDVFKKGFSGETFKRNLRNAGAHKFASVR
jgi:hypothetical protein